MSIGIAVTLPDGALLVADGRRDLIFATDKDPEDNVDKLAQIGSTVFAIPLGVTIATDLALRYLKHRSVEGCKPEDFPSLLMTSLQAGWELFMEALAPDVDRGDVRMRAALLAGGIAADVPFIAGTMAGSSDGIPQPILLKGPSVYKIVLGPQEEEPRELFDLKLKQGLPGLTWDWDTGPINEAVKVLLDVAVDTIRFAESQDPMIGGTIRYAIVRRNFTVVKRIWHE